MLVVTQLLAVPPHRADGHVEIHVADSGVMLQLYVSLRLLLPLLADVIFAISEWRYL